MINNPNFIRGPIAANIMKGFQRDLDQLPNLDELQKAGVGSKGGKVVGYTKSGKAIYESTHSIDGSGNIVSSDKETAENNSKFKHHRLLAAYHGGKAMNMVSKEKYSPKSEEVKYHVQQANVHVTKAKSLHNKKEHGAWMDTIPDHAEAHKYGEAHYKK